MVNGGAGDDSITGHDLGTSTIEAGDGNDWVSFNSVSTGPTYAYGGDGDDTLSGGGAGGLFGEAGNDRLEVYGPGDSGAGFFIGAHGGVGEDTLAYSASAIAEPSFGDTPQTLYGEADADTFEITTDEGSDRYDDSVVQTDGSLRLGVVNIGDFEPGVDNIEVDLEVQTDGYAPASARIDCTDLIIRYEHASEPVRDLVVHTNSADLSWDDISFVGEHHPGTLQPVV